MKKKITTYSVFSLFNKKHHNLGNLIWTLQTPYFRNFSKFLDKILLKFPKIHHIFGTKNNNKGNINVAPTLIIIYACHISFIRQRLQSILFSVSFTYEHSHWLCFVLPSAQLLLQQTQLHIWLSYERKVANESWHSQLFYWCTQLNQWQENLILLKALIVKQDFLSFDLMRISWEVFFVS